MINISIKTYDYIIVYILANGHAKGNHCVNIVCSSFSLILRTFLSVLDYEEERFDVDNTSLGYLEFKASYKDLSKKSLFYYSNFLIRGVKDLCLEYPYDIKLILEEMNGNK
ncbi:ribosomal-processing cysteine protease Prp [Borrelia sp. A-FGy1]|uniref:ribosomal-processing cysteine protease Prp n=1 Tax=Borrelia sp. A-FGy1 TaxID=2608247 RepID=UPI0015F38F94|nr:ribosomal-processing cysteine protease Prp [Borrelia sp. A-FGy1]QMU99523.1 ribosomal-processing cysteine protease Prp [Borrelia sp. A-FGy1]